MTYSNDHGRIDEADGVITVTLDRQDKLNAISPLITDLLWRATDALAERDDVRVMVITAVGRYFTAGIDLAAGATGRHGHTTPEEPGAAWRYHYRRHHLLYDELESIEKPVVLAAQATCLGAGVEMACSCDVRVAAEGAMFGLPEIRMGVIPGSGGVSRLTRLVGPHWAKWLAMLDQRVDAPTARMMGLVHDIYPAEGFHQRVHELAVSFAQLPGEAVGVAKVTVDACVDLPRDSARHMERLVNTPLVFSDQKAAYEARFQK
jgi:enoyl-CoA hydratase